jgi:hypothetical protein
MGEINWLFWEENEEEIFQHVKEETEKFVRNDEGEHHIMPQYGDFDANKEYFKDEVGKRYGGIVNMFREVFDVGYNKSADMIGWDIVLDDPLEDVIEELEGESNSEEILEIFNISENEYENWKKRLGLEERNTRHSQTIKPKEFLENTVEGNAKDYLEKKIIEEDKTAAEVGDELDIGGHHIFRASYELELPKDEIRRPHSYWQEMGNVERELRPVIEKYVIEEGRIPNSDEVGSDGLGSIADVIPKYHNMSFIEAVQEAFGVERDDNSRLLTRVEIENDCSAEEYFRKRYLEDDATGKELAEELGTKKKTVYNAINQHVDIPNKNEYKRNQ